MGIQRIRLDQIDSNTVLYESFYDQVDAMTVPFYQDFTANQSQTIFDLSTNYKIGINSLKVFLNGVFLECESDYEETSVNRVTFLEPLQAGDWVMFRIEGAGSGTTLEDHMHITREVPIGSVNGLNSVFELNYLPRENKEQVYKNGILQSKGLQGDYIMEGKTITFNNPPSAGSKILVNYIV